MTKVRFMFFLKGDMDNWWAACNSINYGMDWKMRIAPSLRRKIAGVPYKKAVKFLKPYLVNLYSERQDSVKVKMDKCSKYWNSIQGEILRILSRITKRKVWPEKIYCFYTSFPRSPYGWKRTHAWMYIQDRSLNKPKRCTSVMLHEIMHLQVHKYFWKYCEEKGLSYSQTNHLKEALTFLINEEFSGLVPHDKGYPIHRKLRIDLRTAWRKDKNFQRLLDAGINLMKTKYKNLK
jgi:hypothetical protein